ncbi:hypothetical protein [Chitinophaga sp. OAE865]|uniref:hypothetical protein n=1 Tax=Chitinophaga sp. OAE865 TaxID=2817898 RepID=UPI001AE3EFB7
MKSIVIILSTVFILFNAQDDDTGKLYVMALKKHIIASEGRIKGKAVVAKDTIFVMNADIVELPEQLDGRHIVTLGDSAVTFLKGRPSLHAIQINPIRVNKGNLVISLNDYVVSQGTQGANFSFGGGKEYVISFNNSTKQYAIIQTKVISF